METAKQEWFSDVFEAGITHQFYDPGEVVAVATPQVLAEHLPRDVMAEVLALAMKVKLTPEKVVSTVSARVLSEHVPESVLWKCVAGAADRAGMNSDGVAKEREPKVREFLRAALTSAVKNQVLRPTEVLKHIDATVLVESLPNELTAKLLGAALERGTLDAALVVDVIGVEALAEHAPPPLLWKCVQDIRDAAVAPPPAPRKARPPSNGAAKPRPPSTVLRRPATEPPRKPPAPVVAPEDEVVDFHEAETDVRVPGTGPSTPELDVDHDGIVEIVEEEDVAEELVAEDRHKKSGKIAGLFSRRKR